MEYNSANANAAQRGQGENRETAYFQSLINDMEIQNKRYSELTMRIESVLQKLANESNNQKDQGISGNVAGPAGYISTFLSNNERFGYYNNRMEDFISKLEKLF